MEKLFGTQQKAAKEILSTLETVPAGSVVYLEGIRGTGKSLVLKSIQDEIEQQGVRVYRHLEYHYEDLDNQIQTCKVVSSGTPWERLRLRDVLQRKLPQSSIHPVTLPGLTLPESLTLVEALYEEKLPRKLSKEELAELSLGIPMLISNLSADPEVTSDVVKQVSGSHLGFDLFRLVDNGNFDEMYKYFLQITPTEDIAKIVSRPRYSRPEHIYDQLCRVYEGMKWVQAKGITEESPLFMADESVKIYDRMLSEGINKWAWIDIFAPEVEEPDLERITQALGVSEYLKYTANGLIKMDIFGAQSRATRVKMFGDMYIDGYRKTAAWFRTLDGSELFAESEGEEAIKQAHNAEKDFLEGKLPFRRNLRVGVGRFYFHRHGHLGERFMPASAGWMVESMLQRRGVSYLANNKTAETTYVYNPEKKSIEYVDFNISRQR